MASPPAAWRNRIVESRIVSAGELRHNPANFRRHPDAQVAALRGLLNQVGIVAPLTAYHSERAGGALTLIDGEARETIGGAWPCDILDVTDAEADLILSAYDAITGQATIDPQALWALLGRIDMTAIEDDGLAALLGQMGTEAEKQLPREPVDAEPQIDRAEELRVKWGTATGQLWQLGEHRLICGDCTDAAVVARVMGGEKIRCVWTDPPYGVSYADKNEFLNALNRGNSNQTAIEHDHMNEADTEKLATDALRLAVAHADKGASVYVACPPGTPLPHFIAAVAASGFSFKHSLVWVKNQFVLGRCDYHYRHELVLYGWIENGAHYFVDDHTKHSVFEVDKPRNSDEHPTMKPVELVAGMVGNSAREGEIVYDPFSGSGTTIIACEQLGRKCRAVEISPAYVATTLQRYQDATATTPQLLEGP